MAPVGFTPPARIAVSFRVTGEVPKGTMRGLGVVAMVTGLLTQSLTSCEALVVMAVVFDVRAAMFS